jgi:hypothetical protein
MYAYQLAALGCGLDEHQHIPLGVPLFDDLGTVNEEQQQRLKPRVQLLHDIKQGV